MQICRLETIACPIDGMNSLAGKGAVENWQVNKQVFEKALRCAGA